MDEAAPQAASGPSPVEIEQGIYYMELLWGNDVYEFGYDAIHGWWVRKLGQTGFLETAATLQELGDKLNKLQGTAL